MYKKLVTEKTNNTQIQLFRSLFVGVVASVADLGGLIFLKQVVGLNYLVAATFSFIAGLLVNYYLSVTWVFPVRKFSKVWHEFGIFAVIGTVGLGLTLIIMWFSTSVLRLFYVASKIIATILVYFWNFFSRKFLLFNDLEDVSWINRA